MSSEITKTNITAHLKKLRDKGNVIQNTKQSNVVLSVDFGHHTGDFVFCVCFFELFFISILVFYFIYFFISFILFIFLIFIAMTAVKVDQQLKPLDSHSNRDETKKHFNHSSALRAGSTQQMHQLRRDDLIDTKMRLFENLIIKVFCLFLLLLKFNYFSKKNLIFFFHFLRMEKQQ